jgi:hypothetical protein
LSGEVEILTIPQGLADLLGIDIVSAQLILSGVIIAVTLAILSFAIRKSRAVAVGTFGCEFTILISLIALGWLPYYLLIIVSVLVALLFSATVRDWITGGQTS